MRYFLSVFLISFLVFFFGCKTTTEDESTVPSSPAKPLEEPEEEVDVEKPQSIVVPVASLGDVSETRKKILQNTLEDELKEHFMLISQERFEEAQEKAFEELDYEECTEDQCIMMIQEMLQVENVFHLEVIGEGTDTQLSLSWRTLDQKKKETDVCINCGTFQLNDKVGKLVNNLILIKDKINNENKESDIFVKTNQKTNSLYLTFVNSKRTWIKQNTDDSIGKYEGDLENNHPQGYGVLTYYDGGSYKGNWLNGLMHGKGERIYSDGTKEIGTWEMNKSSKTTRLKIEEYSNEKWLYLNNVNGINKWSTERNEASTGIYRGFTLNELPTSDGTLNYFNGSIYSGGFKKGELDGWGVFLFKNKDILVGNFQFGEFKQGLEYSYNKGEFEKLNITRPFGFLRLKNGDEFRGHLSSTKPDGFGVMEYKNGEKYIGMWSNNELSGYGIFFKENHIMMGKWGKNSKYRIEEYDYNGNINKIWVKNKRLLNLPSIPK